MIASTPWGFRDILPDEALLREEITDKVKRTFAQAGYLPIETPLLEDRGALEQGGTLSDTPFQLFDDGGRLLVIRPDLTQPVMRLVAARQDNLEFPLRLRYVAPVVRQQEKLTGYSRQFTQLGVELIGQGGIESDIEVVQLAAQVLTTLQIPAWRLVCGSVRPLKQLLELAGDAEFSAKVRELVHRSDLVDLDDFVAASSVEGPLARALTTLPRLAGGVQVLDALDDLLRDAGVEDPDTGNLRQLAALMAEGGMGDHITFDFSIMNSFDYYTGLVFRAYGGNLADSLGSGGRYDSVLGRSGIEDLPALGFALSLERLVDALQPEEQRPLRIAVPKGSLFGDTVDMLEAVGLDVSQLRNPGRKLIVEGNGVEYVIVRPTDAPAFVSRGGADCGICGRDSLVEANLALLQLIDLKYGGCRFIEAEPASASGKAEAAYARRGSLSVATKYPRIAQRYYDSLGMQVDIVTLHGNIELGPIVGMTDRIVDITATGTTLRENNLVITGEVMECTARFFVNPARSRCDSRVRDLADKIARYMEGKN